MVTEKRRIYNRNYYKNTIWVCSICEGRKYSRAAKWTHTRTKSHQKNLETLKQLGLPIPEISIDQLEDLKNQKNQL